MSFSKFFLFGILLWLLLSLLKGLFLQALNLQVWPLQVLFIFATIIISMACARRLGVINYLEAGLVAFLWTAGVLIVDLMLLYAVLKLPVFSGITQWLSYGAVATGIFFFHKKRHVHIRHEQHAHHH